MKVNDEIRARVQQAVKELPMSQAAFARQLGVSPKVLNRALRVQGEVPEVWQKILDGLGLELTVRPAGPPALEKAKGQSE